jgi:hypothetical protein
MNEEWESSPSLKSFRSKEIARGSLRVEVIAARTASAPGRSIKTSAGRFLTWDKSEKGKGDYDHLSLHRSFQASSSSGVIHTDMRDFSEANMHSLLRFDGSMIISWTLFAAKAESDVL